MSGEHASRDPSAERTTPFGRTFLLLSTVAVGGGLYLIMTLVASAGVRFLDMRLPKQGLPLK